MDIEEIDTWYEEEKEKLTQDYRKKIDKSKNHEAHKKKYLKSMDRLMSRYEKMSESRIKGDLRSFFMNFRIGVVRQKVISSFSSLKERFLKK